jgi:2-hydroxy-6-oxonona-2,4-dienedioate hydrolase
MKRFEQGWINVAGHRVSVREGGEGPPVVLVHGLVVAGDYLMPLAHELAGAYRVFVPEMPGFGKSEGPEKVLNIAELGRLLKLFVDEAGLERPALIGNSMGCQIIVHALRQFPDCGSCAVLIGPTMDANRRTTLQQAVRLVANNPRRSASLGAIIVKDFLKAGVRRAWKTFRFALHDRYELFLPHIRTPALVVRGSKDRTVSGEWAMTVANLLPNGVYVELPGIAHTANHSAPERLGRVVHPFLKEHLGRAYASGQGDARSGPDGS